MARQSRVEVPQSGLERRAILAQNVHLPHPGETGPHTVPCVSPQHQEQRGQQTRVIHQPKDAQAMMSKNSCDLLVFVIIRILSCILPCTYVLLEKRLVRHVLCIFFLLEQTGDNTPQTETIALFSFSTETTRFMRRILSFILPQRGAIVKVFSGNLQLFKERSHVSCRKMRRRNGWGTIVPLRGAHAQFNSVYARGYFT